MKPVNRPLFFIFVLVLIVVLGNGYQNSTGLASVPTTHDERTDLLVTAIIENDHETVATVIANGADVNARREAGWTPLHFALANGSEYQSVIMMLIEHGADVNAATTIAGWTPLHIAVSLDSPEIVLALLKHGADVNAQTRVGGWTPLDLALQVEGADEVVKTLRVSRGKEQKHHDMEFPPMFSYGRQKNRLLVEDVAMYGIEPNWELTQGGHAVTGSFTTVGADERLVFESFGFMTFSPDIAQVVGLIDKDNRVHVQWISDTHTNFLGLCRDPLSGLDHAIFSRWNGGNATSSSRVAFMYYNAANGLLDDGFVKYGEGIHASDIDASGKCRWREKEKALETYKKVLATLQVNKITQLVYTDEKHIVLPTRVIPSSVVESSLSTLRGLPNGIVSVFNAKDRQEDGWRSLKSKRWEIVFVSGALDKYPYNQGVVLVQDKQRQEWRSIYDCSSMSFPKIQDNTLYAEFGDCDRDDKGSTGFFEVDLLTYEVEWQ